MSSSLASRPFATSPSPEVTINGRSDPTTSAPRVSIACLSASQFSLNFEKSWLKAQ